MEDNLIERMAIAYWDAGHVVKRWEDEDEDQRQVVRQRMKAAVQALREPTQAQQYVGNRFCGAHPADDGLAKAIWQNMIDVALKVHT